MGAGDRVIKKFGGMSGFVLSSRGRLLEIKWDDGRQGWIPAEEVRAWDRSDAPPQPRLTPRGNTTPAHIVKLRKENPTSRVKKPDLEKIASHFLSLSNERENRSRMKAKKLAAKFERRMS